MSFPQVEINFLKKFMDLSKIAILKVTATKDLGITLKSKLGFNVPFNNQRHMGTGSRKWKGFKDL